MKSLKMRSDAASEFEIHPPPNKVSVWREFH